MKAVIVIAAALLSCSAFAKNLNTPDEFCREVGSVINASAVLAMDTRLNGGSYYDARQASLAVAGDKALEFKGQPMHRVMRDLVNDLTVKIYRMPDELMADPSIVWDVADRASHQAQTGCIEGFRNKGM